MIFMTFAVPVASQPEAIVAANLGSGKVTIGAAGRLVLPAFAGVPGLYRGRRTSDQRDQMNHAQPAATTAMMTASNS